MAFKSLTDSVVQGVGAGGFQTIDQLIQARAPQGINSLNAGTAQQIDYSRQGLAAGLQPLQEVDDLRAFEEQQAILGLSGQQAQEQAIGNIPVSQFDKELQRRQQQQFLRAASASGELGGGATIAGGTQLAGQQQSNIIQQRLAQLSPLVAASRGLRSTQSQMIEQQGVNEAQLQSGLGVQQANIRLGATAPQIANIQNEAELSGLRGISSANARAQTNNQLASLAGSFFTG